MLKKISEFEAHEVETIAEVIIPEHEEIKNVYTINSLDGEIDAINIQISTREEQIAQLQNEIASYQERKDDRIARRTELESLGIVKEVIVEPEPEPIIEELV